MIRTTAQQVAVDALLAEIAAELPDAIVLSTEDIESLDAVAITVEVDYWETKIFRVYPDGQRTVLTAGRI